MVTILPTGHPLESLTLPNLYIEVQGTGNMFIGDPNQLDMTGRAWLKVRGNNNEVTFGDGSSFKDFRATIVGHNSHLAFGAKTRIREAEFKIDGDGCSLTFGDATTMEGGTVLVQENGTAFTTGADCMLSRDIAIRTSDSHGIFDLETEERINPPKSVTLGDHVWVGRGVTITKGTRVEEGAVLAQGALVTGTVPANTVVGGNPAKIIRSGVRWSRHRDR